MQSTVSLAYAPGVISPIVDTFESFTALRLGAWTFSIYTIHLITAGTDNQEDRDRDKEVAVLLHLGGKVMSLTGADAAPNWDKLVARVFG